MVTDDPPTEAEERFLTLLQDPRRYPKWAAKVRAEWELSPKGRAAVTRCYRDVGGFRMGQEWARKRA